MNDIDNLIALNEYYKPIQENINSFQEYIEENFNLNIVGATLIRNILEYFKIQDLNIDERIDLLEFLLDGIGISRTEIIEGLYNYPL